MILIRMIYCTVIIIDRLAAIIIIPESQKQCIGIIMFLHSRY